MPRIRTPILWLLLSALLLAPSALAIGSSSTTVTLESPQEPLAPGDVAVVRGFVEYVADATAYAHPIGVPVTLSVVSGPTWASIVVTPAQFVLPLHPTPGVTVWAVAPFEAFIAISADAPKDTGMFEIVAHTHGTGIIAGSSGVGSAVLQVREAARPCADAAYVVQGAKVDVIGAPAGALVLVAAPAALVGLLLRRRALHGSLAVPAVLLLLALAPLAALPTASAQGASALTLHLEQPDERLAPGERVTLVGVAEYVTDATGYSALSGTDVRFFIADQPEWASVVVTPGNGVFQPTSAPGLVQASAMRFQVEIILADDAPAGALALLTVAATTWGSQVTAPAHAKAAVVLPVAFAPCEADATAPAAAETLAPQPEGTGESGDVTVQTATPVATRPLMPYVVGCALLGGALGLALQRRLR